MQQSLASTISKPRWRTILTIVAVIADAKLLLALLFAAPWFLPDETIYIAQARALVGAGVVAPDQHGGGQPGLPLLLAPLVALTTSPRMLYYAALALVAVVSAVAALPAYFIARRYISEAAALGVAAMVPLLPGSWILSSAVLTEPFFSLTLLLTILCTLRAFETGSEARLLLALACAGLTVLFRPFGFCVVASFVTSVLAWAIAAKRWRELILTFACLAAGAAAFLGRQWLITGGLSLTNYSAEPQVRDAAFNALRGRDSQLHLLHAALSDTAYLVVSGFFIAAPLAAASAIRCLVGFRRAQPSTIALLAGAVVLLAGTLLLAGVMRGLGVPEPMYGRYVEPLLAPMLIAAICLPRFAHWRLPCGILLILGVALAWRMDPGANLTFANNAGYWYWHVARSGLGPICLLIPLVPLAGLMLSRRESMSVFSIVPAGVAVCLVLVTLNLLDYLHARNDFRETVKEVATVVHQNAPPGNALWMDGRMARLGPSADAEVAYFLWAMRFELPDNPVAYYTPGTVQRGDLYLTTLPDEGRGIVWQKRGITIHRLR